MKRMYMPVIRADMLMEEASDGVMIRLETLIELKLFNSSFLSFAYHIELRQ